MADVFDCHIDELFSREVKTEIHDDLCAELPWYDDEVLRKVILRFISVGKTQNKAESGRTPLFFFDHFQALWTWTCDIFRVFNGLKKSCECTKTLSAREFYPITGVLQVFGGCVILNLKQGQAYKFS